MLAPLTTAAIFLVLTIDPGQEAAVRDLLANWAGLQRAVGFRAPDALACVAGIGSHTWDRLFAGPRPAELHPFRELTGAVHRAVSTPGDLLFHIRHERMDVCFEFAAQAMSQLAGAATVTDEVHGFRYFDERDLLGFVDGTENPTGPPAEAAVIVDAEEDPAFAGGTYVIVQRYRHDMDAWNALTVEEQERVIGREKLSNVELADDVKPSNSHVAVNTIVEPDGTERQIVRENMPFGSLGSGESGTYFIGYAATPSVIELMLQRMFVGEPPGNHDRILDFSTAETGNLFFVPTVDFLDDPPALPSGAGGASAGEGRDASLGIGGLSGRPGDASS